MLVRKSFLYFFIFFISISVQLSKVIESYAQTGFESHDLSALFLKPGAYHPSFRTLCFDSRQIGVGELPRTSGGNVVFISKSEVTTRNHVFLIRSTNSWPVGSSNASIEKEAIYPEEDPNVNVKFYDLNYVHPFVGIRARDVNLNQLFFVVVDLSKPRQHPERVLILGDTVETYPMIMNRSSPFNLEVLLTTTIGQNLISYPLPQPRTGHLSYLFMPHGQRSFLDSAFAVRHLNGAADGMPAFIWSESNNSPFRTSISSFLREFQDGGEPIITRFISEKRTPPLKITDATEYYIGFTGPSGAEVRRTVDVPLPSLGLPMFQSFPFHTQSLHQTVHALDDNLRIGSEPSIENAYALSLTTWRRNLIVTSPGTSTQSLDAVIVGEIQGPTTFGNAIRPYVFVPPSASVHFIRPDISGTTLVFERLDEENRIRKIMAAECRSARF